MTIIGLVASGLGVSILPASFKRVQLNEMRWLPISEPDAVSEMWLVWAKHREQGLAAQRFRDYLLAAAAWRIKTKTGKNVRQITRLSKNLTCTIEVLHHSQKFISKRENKGSQRW